MDKKPRFFEILNRLSNVRFEQINPVSASNKYFVGIQVIFWTTWVALFLVGRLDKNLIP